MGENFKWLGSDGSFGHGLVEKGLDGSESESLFEGAPLLPAKDCGAIDEQHLLYVSAGGGGFEEAEESSFELG